MSRGFFGVLAGIGLLIALGLAVTHRQAVQQELGTVFSGSSLLINDLELTPAHGTHP